MKRTAVVVDATGPSPRLWYVEIADAQAVVTPIETSPAAVADLTVAIQSAIGVADSMDAEVVGAPFRLGRRCQWNSLWADTPERKALEALQKLDQERLRRVERLPDRLPATATPEERRELLKVREALGLEDDDPATSAAVADVAAAAEAWKDLAVARRSGSDPAITVARLRVAALGYCPDTGRTLTDHEREERLRVG